MKKKGGSTVARFSRQVRAAAVGVRGFSEGARARVCLGGYGGPTKVKIFLVRKQVRYSIYSHC